MNISGRKETSLNAAFIIPTSQPKLLYRLEEDLEKKFTDYQVVPIEDATSFFDAWRQGISRATKQHLVLTHQDVLFNSIPPLDNFFKDDIGLVGVAGSKVITRSHPWWAEEFGSRFLKGLLSGRIYHGWYGKIGVPSYFGRRGKVTILDGVCLVTPKDTLARVGIPGEDKDWANWHFYDHILALKYRDAGYELMTVPINMHHDSTGDAGSASFQQIRSKFIQEYFSSIDSYKVK